MYVFFSPLQPTAHSTFDRLFNWSEGYNNKLHRDDREHAKSKGLRVHNEVRYQAKRKWDMLHECMKL